LTSTFIAHPELANISPPPRASDLLLGSVIALYSSGVVSGSVIIYLIAYSLRDKYGFWSRLLALFLMILPLSYDGTLVVAAVLVFIPMPPDLIIVSIAVLISIAVVWLIQRGFKKMDGVRNALVPR
jgi:uncharacterized membrane protein YesL